MQKPQNLNSPRNINSREQTEEHDIADKKGETLHSNDVAENVRAEVEDIEELEEEIEAMRPSLKIEELQNELIDAKEELKVSHDKLLRALAEMDNVHRHAREDIAKAHKYGLERFFKELILVIDNLERAIVNAADTETHSSIFSGVQLTLKMLIDIGAKFGLKQVDPLGKPFDPKFHEAVSTENKENTPQNQVLSVLQKGYLLHERLIRPAFVVVSS